jgi:hypothetical protein
VVSSSRDAKNDVGAVGQDWWQHWYMFDVLHMLRLARWRTVECWEVFI